MISDFIMIDGRPMPEPGVFSVKGKDLDTEASTRLDSGDLQRDRLWDDAIIPTCQWLGIPQAESEMLLQATEPLEFNLTYYDPKLGRRTIRAYAAQWEAIYCEGTNNYENGPLWNVRFDIIESSRG